MLSIAIKNRAVAPDRQIWSEKSAPRPGAQTDKQRRKSPAQTCTAMAFAEAGEQTKKRSSCATTPTGENLYGEGKVQPGNENVKRIRPPLEQEPNRSGRLCGTKTNREKMKSVRGKRSKQWEMEITTGIRCGKGNPARHAGKRKDFEENLTVNQESLR
jgi:hypothetical protein